MVNIIMKIKLNYLIIFRPICWLTEIYYALRRGEWIDGHSYISEYEGYESAYHNLKCEVCGKVSKGNK